MISIASQMIDADTNTAITLENYPAGTSAVVSSSEHLLTRQSSAAPGGARPNGQRRSGADPESGTPAPARTPNPDAPGARDRDRANSDRRNDRGPTNRDDSQGPGDSDEAREKRRLLKDKSRIPNVNDLPETFRRVVDAIWQRQGYPSGDVMMKAYASPDLLTPRWNDSPRTGPPRWEFSPPGRLTRGQRGVGQLATRPTCRQLSPTECAAPGRTP